MMDPEHVINWIDRKLWSASTWMETFGRGTKKQRPDLDIEHREEDIAMFEYMRGCFQKALDKRSTEGAGQ